MDLTKLIRPDDIVQLRTNWAEQERVKGTAKERDFTPVCKLHIVGTDMFWMLTELDDTHEMAFGLCQITNAELGNVWLPELMDLDVQGLRVTQDMSFRPITTLSGYATKAREQGGFIMI